MGGYENSCSSLSPRTSIQPTCTQNPSSTHDKAPWPLSHRLFVDSACSPTCTSLRRTSLRRAEQTCTISTSFHFSVHTEARQYTSSPGTIFFRMILPCQTSQNLFMSLPHGRDPSLLSLAINSGKKQVKRVGFLDNEREKREERVGLSGLALFPFLRV